MEPILHNIKNNTECFKKTAYVRSALDALRHGGFLQVVAMSIKKHIFTHNELNSYLSEALVHIEPAIERKLLPSPIELNESLQRLQQEINCLVIIEHNLNKAFIAASQIYGNSFSNEDRKSFNDIKKMYYGFIQGIDLLLNSDLPYISRGTSLIIKEFGTVYLESQELQIVIGPLTDNIGLHTAYVGPHNSFGHIHSSDLTDHPNYEYHFVYPEQNGSHVVGDYRCAMDTINGDIIGIPIDTPHGGYNHGDKPLELHFCAGGSIPWDYPPKDLALHDADCSELTNDLSKINGLPLSSTIALLKTGVHTLKDPSYNNYNYGIKLQCINTGGNIIEWSSRGEVFQVWQGTGSIRIADTDIKSSFQTYDKFALLPGITYEIISTEPAYLLVFSMKYNE